MAGRKGLPDREVEDRDTSDVPLHQTQDRGAYMYLLRGSEGLQGAGEEAETIQYKYEC